MAEAVTNGGAGAGRDLPVTRAVTLGWCWSWACLVWVGAVTRSSGGVGCVLSIWDLGKND